MSWSFHVANGDLDLTGPGGYATVTGTQKMVQDLKDWLLEPQGTDPMHLDFGSMLDGGTDPSGASIVPVIGHTLDAFAVMQVEAEVRRVLAAYQQQQLDRLISDQAKFGGKNTFSAGEILYSVDDVTVTTLVNVVLVNVSLRAADGSTVSFNQPVIG